MWLIIGDIHFRDKLGYSDYIADGRASEEKEILDFIIKESRDCDEIFMLGDFFNSYNNLSSVNRKAVKFLERFGKKNVYIITGNHDTKADGSTALDFLKEISGKNWHIVKGIEGLSVSDRKVVLMAHHSVARLGVNNSEEASKVMMTSSLSGDILFTHNTISDTLTNSNMQTNLFRDVVLPKKELEEKFKLVVGGHIHRPGVYGKTIIAGSVFNNEVGEESKSIWKIDPKDLSYNVELTLPGRPIIKHTNKIVEELAGMSLPKNSIVKMIIDDKELQPKVEEIKKYLRENVEAYILLEQYPNERKKAHFDDGAMLNFEIEDLLEVFAKSKKVDKKKLLLAWELIKD